jgi:signal transduction histidine kinase
MLHVEAASARTTSDAAPKPAELDALHRAAQRVAGASDFDEIVARLIEEAKALCGADYAGFVPKNAVGSARATRTPDASEDPRYRHQPPAMGSASPDGVVRSYLMAPLCSPRTGEILGGLAVGHSRVDVFTSNDERSVEALALIAALAIEQRTILARSRRVEREYARRTRQATLAADVAGALARSHGLRPILQRCAEAIVRNIDAAFARIWTLDATGRILELQASAGMYTHLDGPHARVPLGQHAVGRIAADGEPHVSNAVELDPWIEDRDWAQREQLTSFAGYPLAFQGRVLGVVALFGRRTLLPDTLDALAAVADTVAVGIDRARAEEALREERARFFNLLMDAPAAIAFLEGPEHRFAFVNRRYQALVARPVLGCTVREVFSDETRTRELDRVLSTGVALAGREVRTPIGAGREARTAYFDYVYEPTRDARGEVEGILVHAVEVTEEVEARHHVERANAALEARIEERTAALVETNRELEAFSYTVSHDLRAPIRHIAGFVDLLRLHAGASFDAKSLRYVDTVAGAAKQMGLLIDGLLSFSRTGRATLSRRRFDAGRVVREVLAELQPELEGRNVRLIVGELPVLFGDPTMLRAVFANLIGNAVKYSSTTPDAVIEIGRLAGADAGSGAEDGQVVLFVRDNGVGFDPTHVDKLFAVFQRLHRPDEFEGTGIGLATVRRIVQRHGGRTWAESALGAGATFYVSLPEPSAEDG